MKSFFGRYVLGRTIGVGTFGRVKAAVDQVTGEQVAIKMINKTKMQTVRMYDKLRREMAILSNLRHPHIVRLVEFIDSPSDFIVVMEYVSGGELFDHMVQKTRLGEAEGRHIFQEIFAGVDYCHQRMVIHRDLKPENVLLDGKKKAKVSDFGLSQFLQDGEFLKTSCGSPNYAAPEVIAGKHYYGPEVDVWSLAVMLYALLCGMLPFDDQNVTNLFRKIKKGSFILPGHLSVGSKRLINRMLVVDPAARATMKEIRHHPWFRHTLPPAVLLVRSDSDSDRDPSSETRAKLTAEGYRVSTRHCSVSSSSTQQQSTTGIQEATPYGSQWRRFLQSTSVRPERYHGILEAEHHTFSRELSRKIAAFDFHFNHRFAPLCFRSRTTTDTPDDRLPNVSHSRSYVQQSLHEDSQSDRPSAPVVDSLRPETYPSFPSEENMGHGHVHQIPMGKRWWIWGLIVQCPDATPLLTLIAETLQKLKLDWQSFRPYHWLVRQVSQKTPEHVLIAINVYKSAPELYLIDLQDVPQEASLFCAVKLVDIVRRELSREISTSNNVEILTHRQFLAFNSSQS